MRQIRLLLLLSLALLGALSSRAEDADPPGRVGRISLAGAGVELRLGETVVSGDEALNWPLTTGSRIGTANGARAEVRIGSTALRMDGGTTLELVELSDERIWLRLQQGKILIELQNPEHAPEAALDTPEGRLRFEAPGIYRADVAGGTTAFSAYRGSAGIEPYGLSLQAGERVLLLGGADRRYLINQAVSDDFRQWCLAREQVPAASRHVAPEMTGQEALHHHGVWQETAEYGPVWFPQVVPAGWAPYTIGRWVWIRPWGWTWIDAAPWGFAPFHYGRWAQAGGRWAWVPGAYAVRPVYAPALVAWVGQPGWRITLSSGALPATGWYPLGPREIYYPVYRSSVRHVRGINAASVSQVERIVSTAAPPPGHELHHAHRHRHQTIQSPPRQIVQSAAVPPQPASPPPRRHEPSRAAPVADSASATVAMPMFQKRMAGAAGVPAHEPKPALTSQIDSHRNVAENPRRRAESRVAPVPVAAAPVAVPPRPHAAPDASHHGRGNAAFAPERQRPHREQGRQKRGPHDH